MKYNRVDIPSNQSFLNQWHLWVYSQVSKRFKRNKDRIDDTVQNARLRLLSKDFIGRWFFNPKHGLDQEIVDRTQAAPIIYIGSIYPIEGSPPRSSSDSLWRVIDLLNYAKFDYDRYYYSIQRHTIDSDRVLKLLGYPSKSYESLASLYRQGRLKPAEFTEHACIGDKCLECKKGRESLKAKRLSLAHRWDDPSVEVDVKKLRWNDAQLTPFLRSWRRENIVSTVPLYIMRGAGTCHLKRCPKCRSQIIIGDLDLFHGPIAHCEKCKYKYPLTPGIDAGLLKYASYIIQNEVINNFKQLTRNDDLSRMILNNGVSSGEDESELIGWEADEEDGSHQYVVLDPKARAQFEVSENRNDVETLIDGANLTSEEFEVLRSIDLLEMTVQQYAKQSGKRVPRVNRLRNFALRKLRGISIPERKIKNTINSVCQKFDCSRGDLFDLSLVGPSVTARAQLFSTLYDAGMSIRDMSVYFSYPEGRVTAAINRQCLHDMNQ
jgi:DNA-directed RNA polymerase specialized sigma24 family protein